MGHAFAAQMNSALTASPPVELLLELHRELQLLGRRQGIPPRHVDCLPHFGLSVLYLYNALARCELSTSRVRHVSGAELGCSCCRPAVKACTLVNMKGNRADARQQLGNISTTSCINIVHHVLEIEVLRTSEAGGSCDLVPGWRTDTEGGDGFCFAGFGRIEGFSV